VRAAAVDLEVDAAERVLRHRRALDVPARPATPPRRIPCGVLARLVRLPQREVEPVLLRALVVLALIHLLDRAVRELPVLGERAHPEVDVARACVRVTGV